MKRLLCAAALSLSASLAWAGPQVALHTNQGDIVLELDDARAPSTVANFLQYVRDGHYNGTVFHRVIGDFMIQGGGFTADLGEKPARAPIGNEADNGLKNDAYTIAMARTSNWTPTRRRRRSKTSWTTSTAATTTTRSSIA
jgi:hypothetical protein